MLEQPISRLSIMATTSLWGLQKVRKLSFMIIKTTLAHNPTLLITLPDQSSYTSIMAKQIAPVNETRSIKFSSKQQPLTLC